MMEWIDVHDLVTQLWEEQRFRRASAAIIRGGMLAALEYYLQDIVKSDLLDFSEGFKKKAKQYFSADPKRGGSSPCWRSMGSRLPSSWPRPHNSKAMAC